MPRYVWTLCCDTSAFVITKPQCMDTVHKMWPTATDVACSVVCVSVCWSHWCTVQLNQSWGSTHVGPRTHVLDGVKIPHGQGTILGIVKPTEKHWEVSAAVYTAKVIIQSSITAQHVRQSFVKILWPLIIITNPPTQCRRGDTLVTVAGVCRRHLSSSITPTYAT